MRIRFSSSFVPLALTVAILPLLLGACLFGEDEAGADAKERLLAASEQRYADLWEMLHPDHQAIVSEELFVRCGEAGEEIRSPEIADVRVVDENVEDREIAELGTVESHVVELEWKQGDAVRRGFFDMIKVDDDWRWVLNQEALDAYRNDECPS